MSNEQMTERSEGAEARISVFAEKAAHAFSYCGSEDALAWVQQNWLWSVKPYFDAFIEDVRKTDVPLSTDYFSVDGIYTNLSNPIFTFLSPKIIHPLMEKLPTLSAEEWKVLDEKVFGPYFAAWERLMRALASRYGGTAAVVQFKATLRSSVNDLIRLVKYSAANPDAQWFMAYSERFDALCAAFEQIGVAIAEALTDRPDVAQRDELFTHREEAKVYLRDLAKRLVEEGQFRSLRKVAVGLSPETENLEVMTEEIARARRICERWGWKEGTIGKIIKPSVTLG